jgi:hypothetical protein
MTGNHDAGHDDRDAGHGDHNADRDDRDAGHDDSSRRGYYESWQIFSVYTF